MIDRCSVCGLPMAYVRGSAPFGWRLRCPDEGLLRHWEKERAAR